jgi:hypothetical protein
MPTFIFFSFLFYMISLTMTQTAHGGNFMSLRWIALGGLTGLGFLFRLLGRMPRKDIMGNRGGGYMVWVYLLATLASVAIAQNYVYSGLRWLTHAMMIVSFMIILRGTFHSRATGQLIWVIKGIAIFLLVIVGQWEIPTPSGMWRWFVLYCIFTEASFLQRPNGNSRSSE